MEELKLEQIMPYFPYGLKGIAHGSDYYYLDSVKFGDNNYWWKPDYEKMDEIRGRLPHYTRSDGKPILRPLIDLIKPITHKGETFIPLYILNCMRGVATELKNYKFRSDPGWYICNWGEPENYEFWYEERSQSFNDISSSGITPQLEMFQKLFEWHFDVFGLIEKGLAIDINTLENYEI